MTEEQRENFDANRLQYDETPIPERETEGGGGTTGPLEGCDNVEQAWNFFTQTHDLSDEQAAGIIGNLRAESGDALDPNADNNGNYRGIAQWDTGAAGGRWNNLVQWVEENAEEGDEFDLGNQLDFLWYEAEQRGNIAEIKQYNDVPHTAWYWGRFYEVAIIGGNTSTTPLTNVQHLDTRTSKAEDTLTRASSGDWCS